MSEDVINLPSRFEQLEYLESETSTSGAYAIDTGIKPNQNTGFWIDYNEVSDNVSNYQQAIFGARHASMDKELQLTHHQNGILRFNNTSYPANFNLGTRYQVSLRNRVFTHYDGTQTVLPDTEWQCNYNIHLFCMNNAGTLFQGGATKVYRFKLYDGDTLVRDFIPAYDTILYAPCMYDLVTQTPFYNKGYEELLYPKIEEVINLPYGYKQCLFLESTGTQYINTNYVATNNTGAHVKWSLTNIKNYSNVLTSFGISTDDTADSVFMIPHWNGDNNAYLSAFMSRSENALRLENQTAPILYSIHESHLNYYNSSEVYIDTTLMGNVDNVSENIENDLPLYLFGCNKLNALSTADSMIGRIYRATITEGEEVAMDLIPCLDDKGKPCMYDLITQTPFYNANAEGNDFRYVIRGKIPSWYKRVEYLESTGTQYINTEVIPSGSIGSYIDAEMITDSDGHTMGTITQKYHAWRTCTTKVTRNCGYAWNNSWRAVGSSYSGGRFNGELNFLNSKKAELFKNGELLYTENLSANTTVYTIPMYLFGLNNNNQNSYQWRGKIYRAKISQRAEIIRDFVPCLDENGIPCMFDLVEGIPYYNVGSGEFLYNNNGLEGSYTGFGQLSGIGNRLGGGTDGLPPAYTRVNYLESTGTQYMLIPEPYKGTSSECLTGVQIKVTFLATGLAVWGIRNNNVQQQDLMCTYASGGVQYVATGRSQGGGPYARLPLNTNPFICSYNYKQDGALRTQQGEDVAEYLNYVPNYTTPNLVWDYMPLFATLVILPSLVPAQMGKMQVYYVQFTQGSEITRDLIPCLDDNGRPCMFDRVSRTPFYNSGTGEFLYG